MGYTSRLNSDNQTGTTRDFEPVGIVPLWNSRGQPAFGAFADGTWRKCMSDGHCIDLAWPDMWAGYARPEGRRMFWHGTLLEDKGDASGLNYRRNRYYDPANGRFTQEDPIGLAGGLNVYGFANGDPVTYSDPYGLRADSVVFVGNRQAGIKYWNTLYENARQAKGSADPEVREAARRTLALMVRVQNDPNIQYEINAHRFEAHFVTVYGHGYEGPSPTGREVAVDIQGIDPVRVLAHELAGAESRANGGEHDMPSVAAENNYRKIRGCRRMRRDHKDNFAGPCQ